MSDSIPSRRTARWVTAGLLVCVVLALLRAGIPIFLRKRALDAIANARGILWVSDSRTPEWMRRWVFRASYSPLDRYSALTTDEVRVGGSHSSLALKALLTGIGAIDELTAVSI